MLVSLTASFAAAPDGEAVYKKTCAVCHDGGVARAPSRTALKRMAPENVHFALVKGKMAAQAFNLTAAEITAVTEFVTGKAVSNDAAPQGFCTASGSTFFDPFSKSYWNGWGAGADNARFQSRRAAGLTPKQVQWPE